MDKHPNLFFYSCNEIPNLSYQAKTTLQKYDHNIKLPKVKWVCVSEVKVQRNRNITARFQASAAVLLRPSLFWDVDAA
jgi:hypothetical protein